MNGLAGGTRFFTQKIYHLKLLCDINKELENTLHSFGKIGAMKKLLTLLFFSMSIWFLAARTVLAEECSSNCSGIEEAGSQGCLCSGPRDAEH